jgi:hypothetical protein
MTKYLVLLLISCRFENWKNSGNVSTKNTLILLVMHSKKISKWLHKNFTEFFSELAEKTRWGLAYKWKNLYLKKERTAATIFTISWWNSLTNFSMYLFYGLYHYSFTWQSLVYPRWDMSSRFLGFWRISAENK